MDSEWTSQMWYAFWIAFSVVMFAGALCGYLSRKFTDKGIDKSK